MSELLDAATTYGDPDVIIAGVIDEYLIRYPETPAADIADLIELARSEPDLDSILSDAIADPECAFNPGREPQKSRADIHLTDPKCYANFVNLFGSSGVAASVALQFEGFEDEV